jgi:hypothetical protein
MSALQEGYVMLDIAAQAASQQAGLQLGQQANRHGLLQHRVGDFLLLAGLPCGNDGFAAFVIEQYRPTFALVEMFGLNLRPIDSVLSASLGNVKIFLVFLSKAGLCGSH